MIQLGTIKLFTCEDVAEHLGVTAARIRGFIKKGALTARRVGNTYYITEKKLEEFFECASPAISPPDDPPQDIQKIDAILEKSKQYS